MLRRRSSGIGAPITRSRFLMIAVAVFTGLGLAWWAATGLELVKPIFLPSPGSVAVQLGKLWSDGTLWLDLKASIYRISIGFLIASALAIPIGVLIGSFRAWEAAIEPLVDFIRYMPVVAFVPLSILWSGTGDVQKFLIIFIGTFFQQVLMIMDNVKRVPTDFVGLGRTLGLPDRKILTRIVVPSALPGIWDTLRISLGWAWTWLVLAELVAATSGLGYRITVSQRYFQTNTIIGYILLLGMLGLVTDQVMKALGKLLFRQEGHAQ
ncbi:MAG: ABC transporter permease [Mesorhizobium sp.]|nr:MAG: ABC transporter permease [Mesorhizobium sp.]RWM41265.1 MAG: ABC transporter permease [Mesorhizobium sp.]TIO73799.1 MAG: ABC transporter permease [Mesorhizobium sp.]TIO82988.1 MAG: ABC transporter permease [Mesorhizobium sp.]TJV48730.1 MAG: ABC transporter permease [Mesorhizobium sp.]